MIEFILGFMLFCFLGGLFLRFIIWPIFKGLVVLAVVGKNMTITPQLEKYEPKIKYAISNIDCTGLTKGHKYPIAEVVAKPTPEGFINYYRIQNNFGEIQDVPIELFEMEK